MMKPLDKIIVLLSFLALFSMEACSQTASDNKSKEGNNSSPASKKSSLKYKVTFVELGSVRCIPCQKMQAVMKSVEAKYGDQVKVIFYDVWTKEGEAYGDQYKIKAIPTQVFLDADSVEYFRHVGFFPEEELLQVLKQKGVK